MSSQADRQPEVDFAASAESARSARATDLREIGYALAKAV